MGTRAPEGGARDVRAWIDRLETDPAWTARYRAELAARACAPCDLVLIVAPAAEYPRAVMRAPVVEGYVLIVGDVDEVRASGLPVMNAAELDPERARAQPEHGIALVVEGPRVTVLRFLVSGMR